MPPEFRGKYIIKELIHNIKNNTPFIFAKYGDGEYFCANQDILNGKYGYHNIDNDKYTTKLKDALINSFINIVNSSDNCYIGAWESGETQNYWKNLLEDPNKIKWADYHTFIFDHLNDKNIIDDRIELYKTIQNSNKKKIIVCNKLLEKSKLIFNTDKLIFVKFNNWFDDDFNNIYENICNQIGNDTEPIILTSCGMGAKVLISELYKKYPNGTYIDIGSALDFICTMKDTRCRNYKYNDLYNIFLPILPIDWDDYKYNYVYRDANIYLHP